MAYWTLVILSVLCYVGISALSGKGYYCRDPDTGKLYPVNSTWQSSTFCGNYTCKLRKKDTVKTVVPIREIVIDHPISPTPSKPMSNEVEESESMQTAASTNIASSTILNTIYPPILTDPPNTPTTTLASDLDSSSSDTLNIIDTKTSTEKIGDRYLTEEEIKTISKLLYSVKKSDLEAIVDIYNLAQDIYKEMDKITSQSLFEDTIQAAKNGQREIGRKSYWYEPLHRINKVGAADMEVHGTNTLPTAVERSTMDPYSFFQGPLSRNDFGSLPYFYTVSDFQREHSYVNENKQKSLPKNEKPHCTQATPYQHPPELEHKPHTSGHYSYYPPQLYGNIINKPYSVETQKVIQPSVLLPYPFSFVQHHNMSAYPYNVYYNGKPRHSENKEKSVHYFKSYKPQMNLNTLHSIPETKPHSSKEYKESSLDPNTESKYRKGEMRLDRENKQSGVHKNLLDTLFEQAKIEPKKPDWQTDPLASNVLEEIKAHFEEKVKLLKPISFRKKSQSKLERVGKVLKLDELNRDRRSVDEVSKFEVGEEDFETYVETTTCRSDTDPGFYQMGNTSQPYPACCPRKIENTTR